MKDEPHIDYFNMGQWPVYVGFSTSDKAFRKEMRRLGIKRNAFISRTGADATTHFLIKDGVLTAIIAAQPVGNRSCSQYAALMAHEALHVVQEMQRTLNRGDPFGDEADAYLLQLIVQCCLEIAFKENLERRTIPVA